MRSERGETTNIVTQQNSRRLAAGSFLSGDLPADILLCATAAQCSVVFPAENGPVTEAAKATLRPAASAPNPFCTRRATPPRSVAFQQMPPPKEAELVRARCARIITRLNRRGACRFAVCFQIRFTRPRPLARHWPAFPPRGQDMRCPLKITPAGRRGARALPVKGERTGRQFGKKRL